MTKAPIAEEIILETPLGQLAGLRWKNEGAPPVLCLHDWLDNAASFLPLADDLTALNWVSPIILTEEQVLDCLRNIEAPLQSWGATPFASWYSQDKVRACQAAVHHGRHETIEGHHHFHMDAPEKIAETVRSFILENDQTPSQREIHDQPDQH